MSKRCAKWTKDFNACAQVKSIQDGWEHEHSSNILGKRISIFVPISNLLSLCNLDQHFIEKKKPAIAMFTIELRKWAEFLNWIQMKLNFSNASIDAQLEMFNLKHFVVPIYHYILSLFQRILFDFNVGFFSCVRVKTNKSEEIKMVCSKWQ